MLLVLLDSSSVSQEIATAAMPPRNDIFIQHPFPIFAAFSEKKQ